MTALGGAPVLAVRPRHDWQRFDAARIRYGQVWDWHLVEGPFVREHGARYYCFYSAGNWEMAAYGVDYVVADHPLGPWTEEHDEPEGPRVLCSVPGRLLGPGHNSVVCGPDGTTEFLVYHAWDPALRERRMCLDRLVWSDAGPRSPGPSWTPQRIQP